MEGVYRLITHRFDKNGHKHDRLAGRFLIHQNVLLHLEDHNGQLHNWFPEGLVTQRTAERLNHTSGYYSVIPEDRIEAGHHPEYVKTLDIGQTKPEATFLLNGEGMPTPQVVEIWAECIEVGGRRLSEAESAEMMDKVRQGTLILSLVE